MHAYAMLVRSTEIIIERACSGRNDVDSKTQHKIARVLQHTNKHTHTKSSNHLFWLMFIYKIYVMLRIQGDRPYR